MWRAQPDEAPPLFVRAYVGKNFDQSYYNTFVPRDGNLTIAELPDLRFNLQGDIAPILEVAKDRTCCRSCSGLR